NAPDFFGIGLKEGPEQTLSEAIGHPVLESVLLFVRKELPASIAGADQDAVENPKVFQRVKWLERIMKESALVKNPAEPRPLEEILCQNFTPEAVDLIALGEEAMAAHVEVITLVGFGARDAADDVVFFDDDRRNAMSRQLIGRTEPGRTGSDDDE